jgi:hypothetical protein
MRFALTPALALAGAQTAGDTESRFADSPPDSRMATCLWSFGLAWAREELRCELGVPEKVMGIGWPYGGPMIAGSLPPRRTVMKSAPVAGAQGGAVTMLVSQSLLRQRIPSH